MDQQEEEELTIDIPEEDILPNSNTNEEDAWLVVPDANLPNKDGKNDSAQSETHATNSIEEEARNKKVEMADVVNSLSKCQLSQNREETDEVNSTTVAGNTYKTENPQNGNPLLEEAKIQQMGEQTSSKDLPINPSHTQPATTSQISNGKVSLASGNEQHRQKKWKRSTKTPSKPVEGIETQLNQKRKLSGCGAIDDTDTEMVDRVNMKCARYDLAEADTQPR
ncbi:hypothetical protein RIF29_41164 [Crotalaria pallida]|uniref:Uncharacterized protein n=1 Tax=Crotalaria pallida TaxID=3830 RepID=A0AAN9HRD1_CROPI